MAVCEGVGLASVDDEERWGEEGVWTRITVKIKKMALPLRPFVFFVFAR